MRMDEKRIFVERNRKHYSSSAGSSFCTRNMRKDVFGENVSSLCRVYGQAEETVAHIVAERSKLAQNDFKKLKHDNVAKVIHWKLCGKWGFERGDKWYTHVPEKVLESEYCKLLWDFSNTDKQEAGTQQTGHHSN